MTDTQFNPYGEEFNRDQDTPGRQSTGLVGFLIKVSRGHIKEAAANNILVVISVFSFTLSAIIFSSIFFSQKNAGQSKPPPVSKEAAIKIIKQGFPNTRQEVLEGLPEIFYREDISPDILKELPLEFVNLIPTKQ